jgi:mannosyl-glycoprotein endo-beta-N-acetylglucosaminidase
MSTGRDLNECTPIHTVRDLLDIQYRPMKWWSLVELLQPRSVGYYLNENFHDLSVDLKVVAKEKRSQVLICHDFRGNYLSDKYITGGTKFDDYRFYNWAGCDIFW